jgi:transposase
MAGTAFAGTRVSLQIWYFLMFLICTRTKPYSAKEIQREIGVTYKTAWRMKREIMRHAVDIGLSGAGSPRARESRSRIAKI